MLMIQLGCDITQHHSPQAAHARNDSIDDDAITVTPTQSRALSNTGKYDKLLSKSEGSA